MPPCVRPPQPRRARVGCRPSIRSARRARRGTRAQGRTDPAPRSERNRSRSPPAAQPRRRSNAAPAGSDPLTERKRPRRKLSQALQRLDRELKQISSATRAPRGTERRDGRAEPRSRPPRAPHAHAPGQCHATRAARQGFCRGPPAEDPFQKAQEALRDQQFGRAHELMRKACEAEPNNEIYAMYCLWAALRSNTIQEDGINKLRGLLRASVSDDEHKTFAYYALGHLVAVRKEGRRRREVLPQGDRARQEQQGRRAPPAHHRAAAQDRDRAEATTRSSASRSATKKPSSASRCYGAMPNRRSKLSASCAPASDSATPQSSAA